MFEKGRDYGGEYGYGAEYSGVVFGGGCEECDEGGVEVVETRGSFVFWEHVRSKDTATAVAQTCWTPAWGALVGCCMNRDIMADILAAGEWENPGDIEVDNDPYSCLPRVWGVLKKA